MAVKHTQELIYCSFCGKNQEEVKKIIAGNNVFICNECVELAQEIIREELAEEVLTDLADTPKPQELLNILNNYVIGQDRAKRALASCSNCGATGVPLFTTGMTASYPQCGPCSRDK